MVDGYTGFLFLDKDGMPLVAMHWEHRFNHMISRYNEIYVLYKCAASRPSIESQTNEDEIEVQTETLSLKATPLANGFVKAKTGDDTTDAVYQDWYKAVYMTSTTTNTESGVES